MRRRAVRSAEHLPPGFLDPYQRAVWLAVLSSSKKGNKPMKRLILTAAIMLAASTPAFTQNTGQENDAAMAAVIYMTAQKRCNLTTVEDSKLRGMTISEIERHGLTWEQVVYGEKPMIRQFLKENPVYEKATNNDRAAVRTVCNDARTMLGKKK
jgi:hypothetical protein